MRFSSSFSFINHFGVSINNIQNLFAGTAEADEDITEGGADGRSFESFSDVSEVLYDKGTQFLMTHDLEFQLPQTYFGGGSVKIEPKAYEVEEGEDEEEEGTVVKIIFKPPPPTPAQKGRFLFHHLSKLFFITFIKMNYNQTWIAPIKVLVTVKVILTLKEKVNDNNDEFKGKK